MSMASIFGLAGPKLTAGERAFFRDASPWGFILFARNIETPAQVARLCADIRDTVGRHAMIFIDQEGGRVRRMRPPYWRDYPAAAVLADIYRNNKSDGLMACYLHHRLMADDLRTAGLNADCAPVLDLPVDGADPIISDRAFGNSTASIIDMAHAAMAGLMVGGVAPVIKHIPGHGRATVDSHKALPRITEPELQLRLTDFMPFTALSDAPMAMTAHAVFDCVDDTVPLTLSTAAIDHIVRGVIGFDGLLMSDDLDMKALSGGLTAKTERALAAGCDIALQCSGVLPAMVKVAKGAKTLTGDARRRADIADYSALYADEFDRTSAEIAFDALLIQYGHQQVSV
ncbi:beta-N-acetylhexosaminidase [Fretibacter rubidus]|uniref:beta-N-acetylhexosaminidase n=1 Tax=Fretibacter rubidus TaxID=570162 RepID=UPI003529E9F2